MVKRRRNNRRRTGRRNRLYPSLASGSVVSTIRDTQLITVPAATDSGSGTTILPWSKLPITGFNTFLVKVTSLQIEAVSNTPGGVLIVDLYNTDGNPRQETRQILLGSTVVRFKINQPPSTDWGVVSDTSESYATFLNPSTVPITCTVIANIACRTI
jgi:hypothetical protein